MYDIIIIGAGTAGMTAAIYARRASKKVLVLEANSYGGKIINVIDIKNYPALESVSGFDFATNLYNQTKNLGAEFIYEKAIEIKDNGATKEVRTEKNTYQGKTIILATGSDNRKLNIEKEDELLGKGVSYCATCDGAFYKEKNVAVVGGGNTAIEEALYLSDIAKKVYLIHRNETLRAEQESIDRLKEKKNVEFILNNNVTKLNGEEKLESIEITDKDDKKQTINIEGLFIAVGQIPENGNFAKIINLDKGGYIVANENCHTNIEGIFVAGDNRTKQLRQLVTATSDGATAETEAIKYINKNNKGDVKNE